MGTELHTTTVLREFLDHTQEMESRYPIRWPPEVHQLEDRIAAQRREIQTLLLHNQRLAATHVTLKQDVAAAQDDLRHLSAAAASIKADRDAHVREIYERSLKSEAEARSIDGLPAELARVRADIKELRAERNVLSERLMEIDGDIARAQSELRRVPELKSEIEAAQRDIQRGRAAIELERTMNSTNFQISEAMEKHLVSMGREAQILRSELANTGFDFIRY